MLWCSKRIDVYKAVVLVGHDAVVHGALWTVFALATLAT